MLSFFFKQFLLCWQQQWSSMPKKRTKKRTKLWVLFKLKSNKKKVNKLLVTKLCSFLKKKHFLGWQQKKTNFLLEVVFKRKSKQESVNNQFQPRKHFHYFLRRNKEAKKKFIFPFFFLATHNNQKKLQKKKAVFCSFS